MAAAMIVGNVMAAGCVASEDCLSRCGAILDRLAGWAGASGLTVTQVSVALEARSRGIPVRRAATSIPILRMGDGARQQWMWRQFTSLTPHIATSLATHKQAAGELLRSAGLPVPPNQLVRSLDQAREAAERIGYPVVVKPNSTDKGVAVSSDVRDERGLERAFARASPHGGVLVEKMVEGHDHRLTVIGGRFWRAARREPAHVVGNGSDSVEELVRQANLLRAADAQLRDFPLRLDEEALRLLSGAALTPTSVPAAGSRVRLKTNSNLSTGGSLVAVESTHPDNVLLAERAAALLGLDVAGVDFITTDVSRSWLDVGGAICEVNPNPAIRRGSDAPRWFVDHLFPGGADGRIPIVLVVAARGVGAQVRRVAVDRLAGCGRVGVAAEGAVWIDGARATAGTRGDSAAAVAVLEDRTVEAAVIQMSARAVLEEGLAFDRCNLVIVLAPDHEAGRTGSAVPPGDVLAAVLRAACDQVWIDPEPDVLRQWQLPCG